MPKNIIVQMADRLRAGRAGSTDESGTRSPRDSFDSRAHILQSFADACRALAMADPRFADVKVVAKAERVHVRHETRLITLRISPDADHFAVSGSGLGAKFSANPAHLQEGAVVFVAIEDVGGSRYGAEFVPRDFLEDLART